jgi:tripartite-type tricarboxylate transporter receptor subunit TctC
MRKNIFGSLLMITLLVAMALASCAAAADKWTPEKPIRLICTTDPGSTYDIQARVVAAEMAKALKATVVVENVPGAGHQTGTIRAYRSRPDGYTLLYTSTSNLVNNQLLKKAPWKAFDFVFLATCYDAMKGGSGVMAPKSLGTLDDLIKSGKTIRWGTGGAGSTPHIQAVTYSYALDLKSAYVTGYSGPDMFAAAARGEVDLICVPLRYAEQWKKDLNVGFDRCHRTV